MAAHEGFDAIADRSDVAFSCAAGSQQVAQPSMRPDGLGEKLGGVDRAVTLESVLSGAGR
jgi:hypothetical protein